VCQYLAQTIKTNVIGTLNMLGLAKRVGARSVFIMHIDIGNVIRKKKTILN
jgi:FlaA1/EpsC-like NDP-sugar epimerase